MVAVTVEVVVVVMVSTLAERFYIYIKYITYKFPMVSLEYFIGIILSVALWPWRRLSL
jgi:hypothetical protein